jgi:excisionase family DNA binding protein
MSEPLTYRVQDVARMLDCAPSTLYDCLARGEGPRAVRLGRRLLIPRAALEEWLTGATPDSSQRNGAGVEPAPGHERRSTNERVDSKSTRTPD